MQINKNKIEAFRKKEKLTKTEFSRMIGYKTPSGYSNLIKHQYVPIMSILAKIAKVMGCTEKNLMA